VTPAILCVHSDILPPVEAGWNTSTYWESTTGLKQAKGLISGPGSVEIKQRPIKMGGRTTYWTLPPKRPHFQNGVDR
jgi:hypothetical protein